MTDDFSPELQRELLDDFYTECAELFGVIHAQLAALASPLARTSSRRPTLEHLQRAIHTLKGNCSIVGLRRGEQLAHAVESVLRLIPEEGDRDFSPALADVIEGVRRLERAVTAESQQPRAPITAPSAPAADHVPESPPGIVWRATFAPSAELNARGINLNFVRERLAQLGAITHGAPVIRPDGSMIFEFDVRRPAHAEPVEDQAAWNRDGIHLHQLETPPAAAATTDVAPSSGSASATANAGSVAPAHLVRVDLSRLDELLRITAELMIQRSRLEERLGRIPGARRTFQDITLGLTRSVRDLRAAITRVRLVPVAEIFSRLPYLVRDLERESGKQVQLVLQGEETEIDKYLVERLREPLLHLVRNAISHGVELPADRRAAGKPAAATLTLRAVASGQNVVIHVRDDGAGIDPNNLRDHVGRLGLHLPEAPSDAEILDVLAHPGFSTRASADHVAGRGVGMTVVRNVVRELGGVLALETKAGAGTQFTLRLPLTLSIIEAVIVSAGGRVCAVPQTFIEEIIQFPPEALHRMGQTEVIAHRDGVLPVIQLAQILKTSAGPAPAVTTLVIRGERGCTGLVVERIQAQREIIVHPLQDPWLDRAGFAGATDLGDGRPVLVLDTAAFTSRVFQPPPGFVPANSPSSPALAAGARS